MVLLEFFGCLLDELVAWDNSYANLRCKRSINHHSSSTHQMTFVILGAEALLPSSTTYVAKLCTAQASVESARIEQDHVSDSRHVVAPKAQLHPPLTLLTLLISFCCSEGYEGGVGRILGAVVLMRCDFTHNTGHFPTRTHGFLITTIFGGNESSTGSIMAVSLIRSIMFSSLLEKLL